MLITPDDGTVLAHCCLPLLGPGLPGHPAGEWGCAAGLWHDPSGDVTSHRGVLRPGPETSWRAYQATSIAHWRAARCRALLLRRLLRRGVPRSRGAYI